MSDPQPTPPPDRDAELLRQFLADRNVACSVCGYSLKNHVARRCPECGTILKLELNPSHRLPIAWTLAVMGCTFGLTAPLGSVAGFFGRVLYAQPIFENSRVSFGPVQLFIVALLAFLLLRHRAFHRMPLAARCVIAAIPWGIGVVLLL